jgi:hypothetical protein
MPLKKKPPSRTITTEWGNYDAAVITLPKNNDFKGAIVKYPNLNKVDLSFWESKDGKLTSYEILVHCHEPNKIRFIGELLEDGSFLTFFFDHGNRSENSKKTAEDVFKSFQNFTDHFGTNEKEKDFLDAFYKAIKKTQESIIKKQNIKTKNGKAKTTDTGFEVTSPENFLKSVNEITSDEFLVTVNTQNRNRYIKNTIDINPFIS